VRELELLEERQARSVSLHLKYLQALDGVLEDKKGFYAMQRADQLRELEESRAPDALDALMNRPGHQLAVAEQRRVAGDTTSVAGGDLQAAETWHQRHHVHHHSHGHGHHDNMSVSSYHSQPGRSPAKDDAERLHNPYSIYAPPLPKYNKK
jgi:hypothetical protein